MTTSPLLLFDLDGTITDSFEGIFRCFNYALTKLGYPPLSEKNALSCIGPPLDTSFSRITGSDNNKHIQELIEHYRFRFASKGYTENVVYPGIAGSLATLHCQNILMAICTSKRKDFARKIIALFELTDYFLFISGGDTGITKADQIATLIQQQKIPLNTIMIGDRAVDISSAHDNNLSAAGVLWGYGSREELEAESPEYILQQPNQLLDLVATS